MKNQNSTTSTNSYFLFFEELSSSQQEFLLGGRGVQEGGCTKHPWDRFTKVLRDYAKNL